MLVPLTATDMLPPLHFECCAAACRCGTQLHDKAWQLAQHGGFLRTSARICTPCCMHHFTACLPAFLFVCVCACLLARPLATSCPAGWLLHCQLKQALP